MNKKDIEITRRTLQALLNEGLDVQAGLDSLNNNHPIVKKATYKVEAEKADGCYILRYRTTKRGCNALAVILTKQGYTNIVISR